MRHPHGGGRARVCTAAPQSDSRLFRYATVKENHPRLILPPGQIEGGWGVGAAGETTCPSIFQRRCSTVSWLTPRFLS